jgi:hypothetical protein
MMNLFVKLPSLSNSAILTWWGACLSTLLACIKIWEIWRDRLRLEVGYSFTDCEDVGNKIFIRNTSPRTIIVTHWDLLSAPRAGLMGKPVEHICSADWDYEGESVQPGSTITLLFAESTFFSWPTSVSKSRKILLRLHIAGRRPVVLVVTK